MVSARRAMSRWSRGIAVAVAMLPAAALAQDAPRDPIDPPAAVERDDADAPVAAEDRARQEKIITSGMLAIVGIAIIGGMLIIVTILWGGSLRRRTRAIPPATPPQDELWYLRKLVDSEPVKNDEPPEDGAKPQA